MEVETIQQNVIADEHLPTEGEQFPSKSILHVFCTECGTEIKDCKKLYIRRFCNDCLKKHYRENRKKKRYLKEMKMLKNRLVIKNGKLILLCSECNNEIGAYREHGRIKTFCDDCLKKHNGKKNKKYCDRVNYWSSPQYKTYCKKKREMNKFNGKYSQYSSHPYRGNNGKGGEINFERERQIVRRMKTTTLKFGSDTVFGSFIDDCKAFDKKVDNKDDLDDCQRNGVIEVYINDKYQCPICKNEFFIKFHPPHSYEYDTDGFIMVHCSNCGLVVNR